MRSMVEGARGGDAFCRPPAQKLTVIPDCHEGASPQSIVTISEYGFRARPFGSPRNDGREAGDVRKQLDPPCAACRRHHRGRRTGAVARARATIEGIPAKRGKPCRPRGSLCRFRSAAIASPARSCRRRRCWKTTQNRMIPTSTTPCAATSAAVRPILEFAPRSTRPRTRWRAEPWVKPASLSCEPTRILKDRGRNRRRSHHRLSLVRPLEPRAGRHRRRHQ